MKMIISFSAMILLCGLTNAYGQNVTVQQPVFRNFSVNTTVSVPDRGSSHIGSISRAISGNKNVGFYRPGSAFGSIREHAGARSHVYIHDFAAMDKYLLNQGPPIPSQSSSPYSYLANRGRGATTLGGKTVSTANLRSAKMAHSLKLGQRAEKKGKISLAKLHYRAAAKHGSTLAQTRLAEMSDKTRSLSSNRK